MIRNNKTIHKFIAVGVLLFLCIASYVFYYSYVSRSSLYACAPAIIPFESKRDMQEVIQLFEDNWYWLIASKEYDVAFMLTYQTPHKDEFQYYGKLVLKVMRDREGFKGFLAYYPKNFYQGQVLFVVIKKEFRGRGYAQQLVQCALTDLKEMGLMQARLVTRVENFAAQAVYKKAGFVETSRDESFVHFERSL